MLRSFPSGMPPRRSPRSEAPCDPTRLALPIPLLSSCHPIFDPRYNRLTHTSALLRKHEYSKDVIYLGDVESRWKWPNHSNFFLTSTSTHNSVQQSKQGCEWLSSVLCAVLQNSSLAEQMSPGINEVCNALLRNLPTVWRGDDDRWHLDRDSWFRDVTYLRQVETPLPVCNPLLALLSYSCTFDHFLEHVVSVSGPAA